MMVSDSPKPSNYASFAINTGPFHYQRPVDLALAADADGVHLGQQDIPIAVARQMLGPQRLIGRSTTRGNAAGDSGRRGLYRCWSSL